MFIKKLILSFVFILVLQIPVVAQNFHGKDSSHVKPMHLKLPDNVKSVVIDEMNTISRLMGFLLEYVAKGDAKNASSTALEIRDTNLKQKFNSREIKEIMKILPKGFIKFDQKFHMTANDIAVAVDSNDFKTAINLYSEMTQLCYSCHSTYATERFKNLKEKK